MRRCRRLLVERRVSALALAASGSAGTLPGRRRRSRQVRRTASLPDSAPAGAGDVDWFGAPGPLKLVPASCWPIIGARVRVDAAAELDGSGALLCGLRGHLATARAEN